MDNCDIIYICVLPIVIGQMSTLCVCMCVYICRLVSRPYKDVGNFRHSRRRSSFSNSLESRYNYRRFLGQLIAGMSLITSRKAERSKAASRRKRRKKREARKKERNRKEKEGGRKKEREKKADRRYNGRGIPCSCRMSCCS